MELTKDDYLHWIHCNKCFEGYTRKFRKLFILACQHLSCEICAKPTQDVDTKICPICGRTARTRLLGNVLPPHIKHLFHPKLWQDGLPSAHILRFQQQHRNNLKKYIQRMSNEQNKLQQSHTEARAKAKQQFNMLENARHERKHLESRVRSVIKRRQQMEEERARNKVPPTPPSTTTDESFVVKNVHRRPRYPSQEFQRRPFRHSNPNAMRMARPHSVPIAASFSDFAYVDNSFML